MLQNVFLKLVCTLWGGLYATTATLWCIGGAGIYGSPLPGMGKEAWFIVAYLAIGAGSSLMAGLLAWIRPIFASRTLFVGSLISSPLAGRYVWGHPALAILAFGVPGFMVILAWSLKSIAQHTDERAVRRTENQESSTCLRFTLVELMLLIAAIALAIGHGRVAWVPPYVPTMLMQEFSGNIRPEYLNTLDMLQREHLDLEGFLQARYGIRVQCSGGGSDGMSEHVELSYVRRQRPGPDKRYHDLKVDVEDAMETLIVARGLCIENRSAVPGSRFTERGMLSGFSIRYRSKNVEGLLQAASLPRKQCVEMYVEERVRRNFLSLGKSHHDPYLNDW
jgi:hypothetical protein